MRFYPGLTKAIITTTVPECHEAMEFDVLDLTIEQRSDSPQVTARASLILNRVNPKGTKLIFAPKLPTAAEVLGKLKARRVVFNPPATVVLWEDGTKTVVKCDKGDEYNVMTGIALCYMKKALGNTSRGLNDALNKAKGFIEEEG